MPASTLSSSSSSSSAAIMNEPVVYLSPPATAHRDSPICIFFSSSVSESFFLSFSHSSSGRVWRRPTPTPTPFPDHLFVPADNKTIQRAAAAAPDPRTLRLAPGLLLLLLLLQDAHRMPGLPTAMIAMVSGNSRLLLHLPDIVCVYIYIIPNPMILDLMLLFMMPPRFVHHRSTRKSESGGQTSTKECRRSRLWCWFCCWLCWTAAGGGFLSPFINSFSMLHALFQLIPES